MVQLNLRPIGIKKRFVCSVDIEKNDLYHTEIFTYCIADVSGIRIDVIDSGRIVNADVYSEDLPSKKYIRQIIEHYLNHGGISVLTPIP